MLEKKFTRWIVNVWEACTYHGSNALVPAGYGCRYWTNAQGGIFTGSKYHLFLSDWLTGNNKNLQLAVTLLVMLLLPVTASKLAVQWVFSVEIGRVRTYE
jgi:hypothetical protein